MTPAELKQKLQRSPDLKRQFNEEVAEREAIVGEKEGEFDSVKGRAIEATVNSWLLKEI